MKKRGDRWPIMAAMDVLKIGRHKLVCDFLNKEHELYRPMYKYENHPELMGLALGNYFTSWVNFHFVAWYKHYPDKSNKLFYQVVRDLLSRHMNIAHLDPDSSSFVENLISCKVRFIEELIKRGESDNHKYSVLLLEYEKDKILFEREINKLKGD